MNANPEESKSIDRGVSFQLANLPGEASSKPAPPMNSPLPPAQNGAKSQPGGAPYPENRESVGQNDAAGSSTGNQPGGAPYPENQESVGQNDAGGSSAENQPGGAPYPENRRSVGQKSGGRIERVWSRVLDLRPVLVSQGAVVASWRVWKGRRLGPYYRLAYREDGRQRSVYLGRSEELADRVRRLVDELREPLRHHRQCQRLMAAVRKSLRQVRERLRQQLAARGVQLKGYEFRGVRRAFPLPPRRRRRRRRRRRGPLPAPAT